MIAGRREDFFFVRLSAAVNQQLHNSSRFIHYSREQQLQNVLKVQGTKHGCGRGLFAAVRDRGPARAVRRWWVPSVARREGRDGRYIAGRPGRL